jgi:cell division septation protein DedD
LGAQLKSYLFNISAILYTVCGLLIAGCSSGEYDVEEYEVNYTEKTITADTIKKPTDEIVVKDDKEFQDQIKDVKKDTYTFVVQIGAFSVKSNFEKFYERAKQSVGQEVYFELQNDLYKIRVGYFTIRSEAIMLLDKVVSMGYTDAFIVSKKN